MGNDYSGNTLRKFSDDFFLSLQILISAIILFCVHTNTNTIPRFFNCLSKMPDSKLNCQWRFCLLRQPQFSFNMRLHC